MAQPKINKTELVRIAVDRFRDLQEQPAPIPNNEPAVWDLVRQDLRTSATITTFSERQDMVEIVRMVAIGFAGCRDQLGLRRYKARLQARNGRDMMADYLQERMDSLAYLRGEIAQEDREDIRAILLDLYDGEIAITSGAIALWVGKVMESVAEGAYSTPSALVSDN